MNRALIAVLLLTGCVQGVTQVAGIGSTYSTRCSSEMEVKGSEYFARCTPPSCEASYEDGGISHVVVALDPGRKIVGFAERICIQDLSEASQLFQAAMNEAEPPPAAEQ